MSFFKNPFHVGTHFKVGDKVKFNIESLKDRVGDPPYVATAVHKVKNLSYVDQFVEINNRDEQYYNTALDKV